MAVLIHLIYICTIKTWPYSLTSNQCYVLERCLIYLKTDTSFSPLTQEVKEGKKVFGIPTFEKEQEHPCSSPIHFPQFTIKK